MNINNLHHKALAGEPVATAELFDLLAVRFRTFANLRVWNKSDAEDLVQEALMVVSREYKNLEVEKSFLAWACKVLDNRILSYIRSRTRQKEKGFKNIETCDEALTAPEPDAHLKMMLKRCLRRIQNANRRYARTLVLNYQGFSPEEISNKLEITTSNLYMILSRARTRLKQCLDGNSETA